MTIENAGALVAGATEGSTITAGGSTHTKGSYTQLIASTSRDAYGMWLFIAHKSGAAKYLVDIAFGTTVKIANIIIADTSGTVPDAYSIFVPLLIPAGTQLQARCQCTSASQTLYVMAMLDSGAPKPLSGGTAYTSYGPLTASTTVAALTTPGSNNTPTATYDTISASITADINCLFIAHYTGLNSANARNAISIAVGAAAAEVDVITNLMTQEGSAVDWASPAILGPFYVPNIPAGSRLSARYQTNDITQSAPHIAIYGTDYLPFTGAGAAAGLLASPRLGGVLQS